MATGYEATSSPAPRHAPIPPSSHPATPSHPIRTSCVHASRSEARSGSGRTSATGVPQGTIHPTYVPNDSSSSTFSEPGTWPSANASRGRASTTFVPSARTLARPSASRATGWARSRSRVGPARLIPAMYR